MDAGKRAIEKLFKEAEAVMDSLQSLRDTCKEWKQIIEKEFGYKPKIWYRKEK